MAKRANFSKLLPVVEAVLEKAIEDVAFQTQNDARLIVPYDTGQLHDSIQVEKVGQFSFQISANTDYAFYVHEGYVNIAGKFIQGTPYLTQPLLKNTELIPSMIKDLMPRKV